MGLNQKKWLSVLMVLVGNTIYAFSVKLFILPSSLMSCGTTGIAMVVNHLTGLEIPDFILAFNILMLGVGWWILGRQFAMTTIISSLFFPVALDVLNFLLGDLVITDQQILNVLFGGMGLGLSLGIVIRAGASTGGMDIPPLILEHFFKIPVSLTLWCFDFTILLSQMTFHPLEDLMYGILLILTVSFTLNKVMLLGTSKTEVKIISQKAELIREAVISKVDRGVTMLHAEGGYTRNPSEVILSVVSNHELPKLERLAREVDPDCFMIISRVNEVWGRGFTLSKHQTD